MSRPLRVAHVVGTSGATGVETHLIAMLNGFDRRAVEPTLFVPGPGPLVAALEARGVAVETGAPTRKLAFGEARRLAARWRGAFDAVHAHGARVAFWAVRAARAAGIPATVATLHELRWRTLPPGLRRTAWVALEERSLHRYARLVAVSESVRDEVLARRPEWRDRLEVVPGSTPLLLDPDVLPLAAPFTADRPPRFVAVGRLEWVKGVERVLEAFAWIAKDSPATLEVLGSGTLAVALRARAEALGIGQRVKWMARVDDYVKWLAGADLMLTTSRTESHGLSVLEAMAIGLPVVATAVGGLPELLAGGEAGVLVDPEPEATLPGRYAAAVVALVRDPGRARLLAARAQARAREEYAPARLAGRLAAIYESLAAPAGAGPRRAR